MIIDTHAHLLEEYYDNVDEMISNYKDLIIINVGTNKYDNQEILTLCKKHTNVWGALGIHPHEIGDWDQKMKNFIIEQSKKDKIIAIGEIGLDYYYDVNKEEQKKTFREQLQIAESLNLPVIIHSRDAFEDTLSILSDFPKLKKVMHCFSYNLKEAKQFISINCLIGVNGIITFEKDGRLAEIIKNIDLSKILLETDSPYLTPIPFRGKKNDSSKLKYVAKKIAELRTVKTLDIINQTTNNAIELFDLKYK